MTLQDKINAVIEKHVDAALATLTARIADALEKMVALRVEQEIDALIAEAVGEEKPKSSPKTPPPRKSTPKAEPGKRKWPGHFGSPANERDVEHARQIVVLVEFQGKTGGISSDDLRAALGIGERLFERATWVAQNDSRITFDTSKKLWVLA